MSAIDRKHLRVMPWHRAAGLAVLLLLAGPSAAFAAKKPAVAPSPAVPTAQPTSEPPAVVIPRLEAKLKANPDDRDAMSALSLEYMDVGRPDLALPLTHRLIALGSKSAQVYYVDGVASEQLGHMEDAAVPLEHASALDPTNAQVLFTLTDLYLRTGRRQDAERVAKRAMIFNPSDKHAFLNYGMVLMQEKKFEEARTQFESAAKIDPKDAGPLVLEARAYEGQNSASLALQAFNHALTIDPKNFDALIGKAHLLASQGEIKDAIATYEASLPSAQNDEERVAILDQEAGVYLSAKMISDAENVIKRSIAAYPKVSAAHLAYGDFYAAQNKLNDAEAEWKLALGPNNDNHDALFRLGDYYAQTNKASKAVAIYQRAVQLAPNDPQALAQLGQAYGLNREYEKARLAYRHSFDLAHTPQALAGIAASDYQLKKYKEGSAAFDAISSGASDFLKANPQLYYVMGKIYAGNSERAKAKAAYQRFLSYVKPGTPVQSEVKKLIVALDSSKSTAKSTAKPKP